MNVMQYRKFGNTGVQISALGFGCMRFPEIEENGEWKVDLEKTDAMLQRAFELGVNYFDSAFYYCHSNSEAAIGHALASVRDQVYISTKCPVGDVKERGDYRRICETSLKRLGTDYIDFYHFWGISWKDFEKIQALGLLDEALKLKEEGLIRHVSFSFHDRPKYVKQIIDAAPMLETMLIQYNLLDRQYARAIEYAVSQGLGVVAMGPVAGGRLAAPAKLREKLTGQEELGTYQLALRYVLDNPNIACALSGMENIEMVEQNAALAAECRPLNTKEKKEIVRARTMFKKFNELYCTGCKYCQPCPKGIEIPRIFQAYTTHNVYGLDEAARQDWADYRAENGKTFVDCADCGLCEQKCPQKLKIRQLLQQTESKLNSL